MMGLKLRPEAREVWIHLAAASAEVLPSSLELLGASWAVVPRIENSIVCIIKLAFLFAFITVHLASRKIRQPGEARSPRAVSRLSAAVAVLAGLASAAHLAVLIWLVIAESSLSVLVWVFFLAQVVSWLGLACSLCVVEMRTAARLTAAVWWSSVFLMNTIISAWSLFTLLADSKITIYGILSLGTWPVCCLVLVCAIQRFRSPHQELSEDEDLLRPLLNGEKIPGNITPMATSGWIRRMTFSWLNPLLALGHSKPLELPDIPDLPPELSAESNHRVFSEQLELQRKQGLKKLSVAQAVARSFGREFLFTGFLALIKTGATSLSPLFIFYFVELITNASGPGFKIGAYSIILLMCATKLIQSVAQRHWSFRSRLAGARLRSAVIAEVHEKQLRLATSAKQRHGAGEIVSYIGVDAYRLGDFSWWMHYTWTSVLQLVLSLAILLSKIGWATVACVFVLLVTACIQIPTSKWLRRSQTSFMVAQDRRLRATTEILTSMKIIKLQAWEEEFKEIIRNHREEELRWLRSMHGMRGCSLITFWFSYTIAIGIALGTYSLVLGNTLTASLVFTVFSAFGNTQEPVRIVPELLSILSQVRVSLFRLDRFLQDEEIDPDAVDRKSLAGSETVVRVRDGSFNWSSSSGSEKKTLEGINFEIQKGQKVAVCGAVGSGKTSLLSALLGEIPKQTGIVQLYGSIAYVSQSAWIQTGTIRENVLFGKPYDEQRYKNTLRACALESDLKILPYGDQTEIGERGLNLSGGQKQRVQLARAVYYDADVYLLDDPFSAVDAHTAATLFHECVMKALGSKTVVLVTHQVEFLPTVDQILVMQGGVMIQTGKYEELIDSGLAFEKLVNAHKEALENFNNQQDSQAPPEDYEGGSEFKRSVSIVRRNSSKKKDSSGALTAAQLTEKEEKEIGDLGLKPYRDYLNIAGAKFVFGLDLFSQFGLVAGQAASSLWLAQLVQQDEIDGKLLVGGYTLISWSTSLFFVVRIRAHVNMGLKASRAFFYRLMDSLFKAPMAFFDTTPTGRILSRASNDLSLLDIDLSQISSIIIAFMFDLPSSFLLLIYVVWPYVFFIAPMLYMVIRVERFFRVTAQQVMRLNAMTKAPIVNFSGETVSGVASIRAFGVAEEFKHKNIQLLNKDASMYMHNYAVMEWLVIRVETCGTILMLVFGVLLATFDIAPGLAGMGLSYGNLVNTSLVVLTQWYCQLSNVIVSVERIKQYMSIPEEAPPIIQSNRPPREWPSCGEIKLDNLQLRYRPNTPLVLRGITCRIEGGHKVGVVGRTGSGKSTLIGALFRLVEPAGGAIFIDSLDISTIGLRDLRTKLGIIPQEPTLFRGTVRSNLDPLASYSDHDIWETLDKCQMGGEIRSLPGQLDSEVADEGGNWSAGQRQLFCLGRVLLRRAKILVLDEATASIDSTTDAILQKVLREEFASCTVVTVAHRIPTVIDSDRVMALQDGRLAEYDSPQKLLHIPDSLFGKLVKEYWAQTGANVKQ